MIDTEPPPASAPRRSSAPAPAAALPASAFVSKTLTSTLGAPLRRPTFLMTLPNDLDFLRQSGESSDEAAQTGVKFRARRRPLARTASPHRSPKPVSEPQPPAPRRQQRCAR